MAASEHASPSRPFGISLLRTAIRRSTVVAVKSVHTFIWVLVEGAVGYLLFAGLTKRSDRRAATAGLVVVAEGIVYLANGARCPLTSVAESLGAEGGSVTDIYLPRWLARNLPVIHIPLLALALVLHRGAFLRLFRTRTGRQAPAGAAPRLQEDPRPVHALVGRSAWA